MFFYTLERKISIILLVAILILAGIGVYAYYTSKATSDAVEMEKHTQQVIQALDEVFLLSVESESSVRGFIVTGREEFLEPYYAARSNSGTALLRLRSLTDDNTEQQQRINRFETQLREKFDFLEQGVVLRRSDGGLNSVITTLANTNRGKDLMDRVRQTAVEIKAEEFSLLKQREDELDASLKRTLTILMTSIVVGMLMLIVAEFVVLREIKKRQKAEDELRETNKDLENRVAERAKQLSESELFSQTILNSLSAHIAVLGKDGKIIAVNDAWDNFAKSNATESQIITTGIGQNYISVCGDIGDDNPESEITQNIGAKLKAVLDGKSDGFIIEYPCHSPTEDRWFLMQVNSLSGGLGGAVVSHINITDRKKAEDELKNSEEFSRSIVESSTDCVKVLNLDGIVISMNQAGMCLMEVNDFKSIEGKLWTDNWQDEDNEQAWQSIERARRGESATFQGFAKTFKGTSKWWDVTVSPVRDAAGRVSRLLVTSRDITERKNEERERENLLVREQAARAEAEIASRQRDEFMAVVSHELRTPLNAILGWARLMKQGRLNEEMTAKAVETIIRSSETQNRLIEDLLDVARIVSGKLMLEKVEIGADDLVNTAIATVKPSADAKSISVNITIDENQNGRRLSGDPNRLQQVIWNLLANAIKFTPEGGTIDVNLASNDGLIEIKVTDSGVGINPEFLPFVFERFRQEAGNIKRSGGLGLGLAIVRHLTEMHGGTVSVESDGENKGSIFTVKLPKVSADGNNNSTN